MRSILEKGTGEKERRRNSLIIGGFLIFVMLFSTLGFAFFNSNMNTNAKVSSEKIEYNGLIFEQTPVGTWKFEISGFLFETRYNPQETQNISVISLDKDIMDYQNKVLYFGVDSDEEIFSSGNQEVYNGLRQFIPRSNFACLSEECTEDYPIKDCSEENIIIFKEETTDSRITNEEGCVYIYSQSKDQLLAADAFLFRIFGVN